MRYKLDKSQGREGIWLCTDTLHGVVVEWQEGDFNGTQKVTHLYDIDEPSTSELALQMREMGDWLAANDPELL